MPAQATKRCPSPLHVGERELPLDAFSRRKDSATGRKSWCRKCLSAKWAVNRPENRRHAKAHYDRNQARLVREARERRKKSTYGREYAARRRRENPELIAERIRISNSRNPERMRRKSQMANLRHRQGRIAAGESLTSEKVEARWAYYGNCCWICGCPAEETDHVKPLIKGGVSWPSNLRPICSPCNRRKSGIWPLSAAFLKELADAAIVRP